MVLYSDKRPVRFCRKARSIASLKVSDRTPGVALASGTLPKTEFCAEVGTCTGSPAELGAGLGGEPEVEVSELDFELWAESGAGSTQIAMTAKMTGKMTAKTLHKKNVRRHCDRGVGRSAAAMGKG
jgi:hypothetical protein